MTDLRKRVERRTVEPVPNVRRQIVCAFEPGDVLAFRESGRRRWYRAPIGKVFLTVARWNVDAERQTKGGRA
jgi:hypothetical protein